MTMINDMNVGILITNLGTPLAPTTKAVKNYLAEFLGDPFVVPLPKLVWWPILNGLILPTRASNSAKLYQKIWTPEGSPLLSFSQRLTRKVAQISANCPIKFNVELGMRYGEPSIRAALKKLQATHIEKLIVLPLYPQFSSTTTASSFAEVGYQLKQLDFSPALTLIDQYAIEPEYISAITNSIQRFWQTHPPGQKLLFSFHGLPKKRIDQGDPYYNQCHETAGKIAYLLNLPSQTWSVVFQSRFGKQEWLKPYCDTVLDSLPKEGIKEVDIVCPGFPVDCLETLEEIAITNKRIFHNANGTTYHYIPALNDSDEHASALLSIILKHL